MPMMPDEIKVDHCYRMTSDNKRPIIVRVINIVQIGVRIQETNDSPVVEASSPTYRVVRFMWRDASPGTEWAGGPQQETLDFFALRAEAEVECG